MSQNTIGTCDFSILSASVADGIAVDPISRLLFYTDTGKDTISLMKLDGTSERVIVSTNLDEPRDIEVDPING